MIALLAAVHFETELLRRSLSPCEVQRCFGYDLYRSRIGDRPLCLMHSGVGKASAAAAATTLVIACRPELLIMIGCGGAYPGCGLEIGDLALATSETYGDEGVQTPEGFLDLEMLGFPLVDKGGQRFFNRFPISRPLLDKTSPTLEQAAEASGCRLAEGPFVTVSSCSGNSKIGTELSHRTGGICENMEGAAAAQVCAMQGLPFLELRGISNMVEDRDVSRWDLKAGAEVAQKAVLHLLANWQGGKEPA